MDLWGRVPGGLVPRFTPGYFPARRWRASLRGGFKMTLAPTKGEFTDSLLLPANGRRVTFTGALLEKSGEECGALLNPDAEVALTLGP